MKTFLNFSCIYIVFIPLLLRKASLGHTKKEKKNEEVDKIKHCFLFASWYFQISQVSQPVQLLSRVWLCDPMNCSTPGLPVHHQLPESTQTHVHWVGDAIQSSRPLSSPSPPAFIPSQHQGLFQGVSSLYQVVKVLGLQLQYQSFQWIFRTDFL